MTRLFALLFLVTACTIPQTSETKEDIDSVAVLSEDTLDIATDEMPAVDTISTPLNLGGKFDEPQIDRKVGYVYAFSGLDVFNKVGGEKIGHLDYKSRVKLRDDLADGYVAIEYNNDYAFVDSSELLPLPVPDNQSITEYFTNTLMLMEDPVEKKSPEPDNEGSFSFTQYVFEGGIIIEEESQYESGSTLVRLPGMSIRKAYLLASYFYKNFDKALQEFPTSAIEKDLPDELHLSVQAEAGQIINITVGSGEGCYWEDSVSRDEEGSLIRSSGGC